jgi:hypothetical protein
MIHLAPDCGVRATFVVEALFVTSVSLVRLPKHETRDVRTAEHTMLSNFNEKILQVFNLRW